MSRPANWQLTKQLGFDFCTKIPIIQYRVLIQMSKFLHFFRDNDDDEIKISFYNTVKEWTTRACPGFFIGTETEGPKAESGGWVLGEGMQTQILSQATETWQKKSEIPKFKMADGRHIENHLLAITRLVYRVRLRRNFGVRRHNCTHTMVRWWKCSISKIQHGGLPPFWQSLYLHISAANCPNFMKFSMQTQILPQAMKHDKNSFIGKFKIADGCRIEDHFLAITPLDIVPLRRNLEWGGRITCIRSRSGDESA